MPYAVSIVTMHRTSSIRRPLVTSPIPRRPIRSLIARSSVSSSSICSLPNDLILLLIDNRPDRNNPNDTSLEQDGHCQHEQPEQVPFHFNLLVSCPHYNAHQKEYSDSRGGATVRFCSLVSMILQTILQKNLNILFKFCQHQFLKSFYYSKNRLFCQVNQAGY